MGMYGENNGVVERILNNVRYYGSTPSLWLRGVSAVTWTMVECSRCRKNVRSLKDIESIYNKLLGEVAHRNGVSTDSVGQSASIIMNNNINELYAIIRDIVLNNEDMYIGIAIMAEYFKWNCDLAHLFYMENVTTADVYEQLCILCNLRVPKYGYRATINRLSYMIKGMNNGGFIRSSRNNGNTIICTDKIDDARGYTLRYLIEESRNYYKIYNRQLYMMPPLNKVVRRQTEL